MTQNEVIKILGITLGTYINWDKGKIIPSKENIEKIKEFFYLSEDQIWVTEK